MKMIKILLAMIIISFTIESSGQENITVNGVVKNENGSLLEFATVALHHIESNKLKGTITDDDGQFRLETKEIGNYELRISFIGFQEWKKEINLTESTDIGAVILIPDAITVEELVISADRVVIEKRNDKLIFNVDQSPMKKGFDGMEVLERSPNILIGNGDEILMRNQTARVQINGRQTNLSVEELASYLKTIRSENIKSIEVQTHQTSSTDAESTGGIINIILKKNAVGFAGSVRSEIGLQGDGLFNSVSGLNLNYGAQKWNIYGGVNISRHLDRAKEFFRIDYFDTDETFTNDGIWDYYRQRFSYHVGFVFDPAPNHTLGFEYAESSYENVVDYIGSLIVQDSGSLSLNGEIILDDLVGYDQKNATYNYAWEIDSLGTSLKVFLDYLTQDYLLNNDAASTFKIGSTSGNFERNLSKAKTDIYSAQTDFEKQLFHGIKLQTGLKYTQIERDNSLDATFLSNNVWFDNVDRNSDFDFTEKISAGFLSLSKKLNEKNFVNAGLRIENTNLLRVDNIENSELHQNYTNYFPSLLVSHEFANGNILSFNYIKSLRRPSFRWLNNNVIRNNDFRYHLGNPNLRPEYRDDFEVSLKQKNQSFTSYYRLRTETLIGNYFIDEENISYFQYDNTGREEETGIEYNRFGNIKDWWYIKVSANLYYRQFKEDSGDINFRRVNGYTTVSNNFKIGKTMNFDLSGVYYGRSYRFYYIQRPYYHINANIQKTFWDKKLSVRLYFDDIFDMAIYQEERLTPTFFNYLTYKERTRQIRLLVSYNFSNTAKVNKRKNASKNDAQNRF